MNKRVDFLKYFYSPLLIALVFIISAFLLYFRQSLNLLGIVIFSLFVLVFDVLWIAFFAYLMDKTQSKISWQWLYIVWLISLGFFVWALYSKLLTNLYFYRDIIALALSGVLFFQAIDREKWAAFALGIVSAYLYYASIKSDLLFYTLVLWLIIVGLALDKLKNTNNLSIKQITIYFVSGIVYLALAIWGLNIVEKIFF